MGIYILHCGISYERSLFRNLFTIFRNNLTCVEGRYSMTSYTAIANSDGTYTVRMNPEGKGENAIPTMKKPVYAIMRVYQPKGTIVFPPLNTVRN